ncbi:MAG: hypothetical protein LWW79_06300 [Holophagaceae bacterium]|nr:hypothetical protein [Holophagaceae bacterium]
MHPPLITRFLLMVAGGVVGVLAMAFFFIALSPWLRRLLSALLRDSSSSNPR